jgi:ketosteroid isomerase-like protein
VVGTGLIDLYNRGTSDFVESCCAEEAEWIELPFPGRSEGRHAQGRADFRDIAEQTLALFPDRRMEIRNLIAGGNQVALVLDWVGTAAVPVGDIKAGEEIRARIATFLTFANGMIIKQIDDPFMVSSGGA